MKYWVRIKLPIAIILSASPTWSSDRNCDGFGSEVYFEMATTSDILSCFYSISDDEYIQKDDRQNTPLMNMVLAGVGSHIVHEYLVLLNISEVNDVLKTLNIDGLSAIHLAAQISQRHEEIVALSAWGDDIDLVNSLSNKIEGSYWGKDRGTSPLMLAAQSRVDYMNYLALLSQDADLDYQDQNGNTALHFLAKYDDRPEIFQLFSYYGKSLVQNDNGNTPIHIFMQYNTSVESFLKFVDGYDQKTLLQQDNEGKTFIHLAAAFGTSDLMASIFENFEPDQVCIEDDASRTAVDYAKLNENLSATIMADIVNICRG